MQQPNNLKPLAADAVDPFPTVFKEEHTHGAVGGHVGRQGRANRAVQTRSAKMPGDAMGTILASTFGFSILAGAFFQGAGYIVGAAIGAAVGLLSQRAR